MKRITIGATACLVFLACFTVHLTNGARDDSAAKTYAPKPTVTIVFRGLMVFHSDPAGKYFEAGMLPAPEHRFRIEVRETSASGVSSFSVPVESSKNHDVWTFELPGSTQRGINFYKNGAFDRKAGIGDERDFRWAVDVEGREFYNQQLSTKQNQLGPVMRVTSGEFYTKTRTRPLLRNKGNGDFEYFGRAADEIAADLSGAGDVVLRSANSGKEILRLKDKPGTTYEIVVENEFVTDAHTVNLGHFGYYYRLITKPRDQWYDFKAADLSPHRHFNHYAPPTTDEIPCMPWGFGKRSTSLK